MYVFAFNFSVAVERGNDLPIREAIFYLYKRVVCKLVELVFSAIFSPSIEASRLPS